MHLLSRERIPISLGSDIWNSDEVPSQLLTVIGKFKPVLRLKETKKPDKISGFFVEIKLSYA